MLDNAGNHFIFNNSIKPSEEMRIIEVPQVREVYEVIRTINRVPLFFEDHYSRLENSLKFLGYSLNIKEDVLRNQLLKLIDANSKKDCNVRLIIYADDERQDCLLYVSKSYYPVMEEIEKGVPVSLINWDRENPNAKIVNTTYKEAVAKKIKDDNVFEVLLVDSIDRITEGSRSNVFFVKDSKVLTAPGEYVLKGITRQYIIDTCNRLGIELVETLIDVDFLSKIDGLFISGTSIKVLPVSRIEELKYNSSTNPLVLAIRDEFDRLIDSYIASGLN